MKRPENHIRVKQKEANQQYAIMQQEKQRKNNKKQTKYCLKDKNKNKKKPLNLGNNINQGTKRNSSQLIHSIEQLKLINSTK